VANNLDHIHQQALKELEAVANSHDLQNISVRYLGRKGALTQFLRNISKLPVEQRPVAGKKANEIKILLEKTFKEATAKFEPQNEAKDA
jgi:phenylalanyl-tRNA synthetase alpha chain